MYVLLRFYICVVLKGIESRGEAFDECMMYRLV